MASQPAKDELVYIELKRGKSGLGFNIRGGTDIPHIKGSTGIFVTKIRDKGAAVEDGELKEGDQIVEINGSNVRAVTHTTAVNLFLTAGSSVNLKVIPGKEEEIKKQLAHEDREKLEKSFQNGKLESLEEDQGSSLFRITGFVLALAVVAGSAFIAYKYVKRTS